jgi:hypothetical protein
MMNLRIMFEAKPGFEVNDTEEFKALTEMYLYDFLGDIEFAGSISMDCNQKDFKAMEPVWQYIGFDIGYKALEKICDYLEDYPPHAWTVHTFLKNTERKDREGFSNNEYRVA